MSGERPKRARLSNEVLVKPVVKKNLLDMPDLPILHIASFLDGKDLLNFTHICRRFYHIYDRTWQRLYSSSLPFYKEIADAASTLVAGDASAGTTNVDKLTYFMHVMTRQNWNQGRFVQRPVIKGRDGMYFITSGREGVGILELIEDEESNRVGFIFRFWDVKSGNNKTFPFNAPLAVDMLNDWENYKTICRSSTNGSVLIIQFFSDPEIGFVALKLDDTDLEAKDLWQTNLDLWQANLELDDSQIEWRMDSEENMLTVFNRKLGTNDAKNLHVRGFSLQTGAQLWSQVINDVEQTPEIIASEKNWIVLGCDDGSKICALDKVQNSHKILLLPNQNGLNKVFDLALAVQQGRVLGLGNNGTAIIWNLVSGEVLHQVEHSVEVEPSLLEFLNEGKILQFDPTKLQFTLWAKKPVSQEEIIQTMKMKPGGVGFEIIDQKIFRNDPKASGDMLIFDYYCLSEVGAWEGRRANILLGLIDSEYNEWDINIRYTNGFEGRNLFVAPTFVAFEDDDEICVNDFLNVAQFT